MLKNFNPDQTVQQIVGFLQTILTQAHKKNGVIAVSGGIDSALSLKLLVQAIGQENVYPLFLPYGNQTMDDAQLIVEQLKVPKNNCQTVNIQPVVEKIITELSNNPNKNRLGNIMARVRMILLYDQAAIVDGLVCGTENKSEKYLGYFTRFGDEASDLEPLQHLYKTQVRKLAEYLQLPAVFLEKPPSAGLWPNQTDELELGFSYEQADLVLEQLIDQKIAANKIQLANVESSVVEKIINRVRTQAFKRQVPYHL